MPSNSFLTPIPRPAIADPELFRPDWTQGNYRNSDFLWLDKNENSDPILAAAIRRILNEIPNEALYSYPESGPLYRKLAGYLDVDSSNLLLSPGSDGAIRFAFDAYVSPGDVVVFTKPTFAMYEVYSRMYGADARPAIYQASNQGPKLSVDDMIDTIVRNQPKMVCLPNPDSPTGTVFSSDELRLIVEAAGATGALMLVDEAYYPFYPQTVLPWIYDYPHLVVTRSTGKAWGLAGFRVGFAVANRQVISMLHKARSMYETNTIAVTVMERMLDHHDEMIASVQRLNAGKKEFLLSMRDMGFPTLDGHGNFLHVAFGKHAEKIHNALSAFVYYRKDFKEDCLKGFSRFSATTPERFRRITDCIRQVVEGK